MKLIHMKLIYILIWIVLCHLCDAKRYKNAYEILTDTKQKPISFSDINGSKCGDWKHFCISISGLKSSGNPEINDKYCIYECDINNYIKFQSQTTCSYYIKWIPNHYIIYSYKHVRFGTISNHLFASARECNRDLNGYEHLNTCLYWNVFDKNDNLINEYNVTVTAVDNERTNECTTPTGISKVRMDRGEIAAIVIIILAVFVVAFGGAMRYH
eukprot:13183_1